MSRETDHLRVDLKEHIGKLIDNLEARLEQDRRAIEKRLDVMNEWRDALKDQASRSPTRDEIEGRFAAMEASLKELHRFKDEHRGSASQSDLNDVRLLSYLGLLVAVVGLILRFLGM